MPLLPVELLPVPELLVSGVEPVEPVVEPEEPVVRSVLLLPVVPLPVLDVPLDEPVVPLVLMSEPLDMLPGECVVELEVPA